MTKFEQDKIGRKEIVEKILWLVDNLQKNQHFCLALNGEWGSGKSFVLEYIEEELQRKEEYIIVKYDAWKNSFYQDPLIAILYCILDSVKEYFYYVDTAEKKFKRVARFLKGSLQQFLDKAMGKVAESPDIETKKIAIGYYAVKKVAGIIKAVSANQILNHEKFSDFKSYQDLLKQAQDLLNEIAEYQMYEKKQFKLIILVDEIDRCLPNEQLRVLERLHHLFDVNNCVVIVSVNKETIITTFAKNFGGNGGEYLRKFFNYEFKIETKWQTLLTNKLKDLANELNENLPKDSLLEEEKVLFTSRYIGAIFSSKNRFGQTLKMENRKIDDFIKDVKFLTQKIPAGKLNHCHFWFCCAMLFYRIYDGDTFKKYHQGNQTGKYENVIQTYSFSESVDKEYRYYLTNGSEYYHTYTSNTANTYNYFVNKCLFRNTERNEIVDKFFGETMGIVSNWDMALVETLFKEINNYCEGNR